MLKVIQNIKVSPNTLLKDSEMSEEVRDVFIKRVETMCESLDIECWEIKNAIVEKAEFGAQITAEIEYKK